MHIDNTEVSVKLDIRQAQSLLMFLREAEGLDYSWRVAAKLPRGVIDDVKSLKTDFEQLLMMADQRRR